MLQQTTVQTVIPYFEKFIRRFPKVSALAQAPLEEVLEMWSGLGYYSRARHLHESAKILAKKGFPQKASELMSLPGFGPYTSRAVSSLAFGEKIGVLDGNVIRVLCRVENLQIPWWQTKERFLLQSLSDTISQYGPPEDINQGLMELGATICTPTKPCCFQCPWAKNCLSLQNGCVEVLPLQKPKKKNEIWIWKPNLILADEKIALVKNNSAPFLKGQFIIPGVITQSHEKPKTYGATHSITHHQIYIQHPVFSKATHSLKEVLWVPINDLKKVSPFSVTQKILKLGLGVSPPSSNHSLPKRPERLWTKVLTLLSFLSVIASIPEKSPASPVPAMGSSALTSSEKGYFFHRKGFSLSRGNTQWIPNINPEQLSPPTNSSQLPPENSQQNSGKEEISIRFENPLSKGFLSVRTNTLASPTNLMAYTKKWTHDYAYYGFDLLGTKPFSQGKTKGYVVDLYHPKQLKQLRQVIFLQEQVVVTLTCSDEKKSFPATLHGCNAIIKTFSWLKSPEETKKIKRPLESN